MNKQIKISWKRLVGMLSLDKRDIKQICYYAIFVGIVSLSIPLGIQAIINLLQTGQISSSWVVLVVLVTIGVAFQGVLQMMQIRILENIQQKIFTRTSFEFSYRFPKINWKAFQKKHTSEYANYFFDVVGIQKGLSKILLDFPAALLQIVFGLLLLSFYHSFFIFYGLLFVFIIYFLFKYSIEKGLETSLEESNTKYSAAVWIQQIASQVRSFKTSNSEEFILNRNNELTDAYLKSREKHFRLLLFQFKKMIAFKVFITVGLLLIGGILVLNQKLNIGQFVASEIIILMIINSVEKMVTGLESFYDVLTSLEKIAYVVDKDLDEAKNPDIQVFKESNNKLEVKYIPEMDLQQSVFEQGKTYILQSDSRHTESMFFEILSGFSQKSKQAILLNDIPFSQLNTVEYQEKVATVFAQEMPFKGTIYENISFGNKNISRMEVLELLEKLGLKSFIQNLENGIETLIQPYGTNLPDAVAKKILLARVIMMKPKILMLDHIFSHMSKEESQEIIACLEEEKKWILLIASNHDFSKHKDAIPVSVRENSLNLITKN
ncbi:ABC transporter transmembrane domain-containing protein [Aureivirga marina]|uniref:ABC transporter transmembrane domain-containing protein n=1 Tax=Aureivirga marina TaxID=1182451 RepID=UPI0018C9DF55|nr:ABC transporter ATP-binding protein [Aureivirga marina]